MNAYMMQILAIVVAFAAADMQTPPEVSNEDRTRIELNIHALIDLHKHVRAVADGSAQPLPIEGFEQAVEAARVITPLVWGMIDGALLSATDAAAMLDICRQLPPAIRREGQEIAVGEAASAYAESIASIEATFLAEHWPQRLEVLQRAKATLAENLLPHQEQCFAHMLEAYAIDDPKIAIPVHLVSHAPQPGAVTYRTRSGSQCIVAVADLPPLQLAEIVLHEASHALDVATMRQPTALMQVRRSLQAAGLEQRDPKHRDIWHTIMFIQSAETIRRIVDPEHVDYGDRYGYYQRVAPIARVQRPIWRAYLDGQITLDQAVERIVSETLDRASVDP